MYTARKHVYLLYKFSSTISSLTFSTLFCFRYCTVIFLQKQRKFCITSENTQNRHYSGTSPPPKIRVEDGYFGNYQTDGRSVMTDWWPVRAKDRTPDFYWMSIVNENRIKIKLTLTAHRWEPPPLSDVERFNCIDTLTRGGKTVGT